MPARCLGAFGDPLIPPLGVVAAPAPCPRRHQAPTRKDSLDALGEEIRGMCEYRPYENCAYVAKARARLDTERAAAVCGRRSSSGGGAGSPEPASVATKWACLESVCVFSVEVSNGAVVSLLILFAKLTMAPPDTVATPLMQVPLLFTHEVFRRKALRASVVKHGELYAAKGHSPLAPYRSLL